MLETVKDEHPQAVKQALDQIVPVWMSAFKALLGDDAAAETQASWESLGIRIEIFRVRIRRQTMGEPARADLRRL
jgi:uncharacterized protein YcbX